MSTINGESQIGLQPIPKPHVNMENTIASTRERLKALPPRNEGGTPNNMDEMNPAIGMDLTNLLFGGDCSITWGTEFYSF